MTTENHTIPPIVVDSLVKVEVRRRRTEDCKKAVAIAEKRLERDAWPEYYDRKNSRLIGKHARHYQTWTCAGYLVARMLLAHPEKIAPLIFEEDQEVIGCALRVGRQY